MKKYILKYFLSSMDKIFNKQIKKIDEIVIIVKQLKGTPITDGNGNKIDLEGIFVNWFKVLYIDDIKAYVNIQMLKCDSYTYDDHHIDKIILNDILKINDNSYVEIECNDLLHMLKNTKGDLSVFMGIISKYYNKINYDKKECYSKELNEYINLLDWQLTFIYNLQELINSLSKKYKKEKL
jgi:hypothetical protein